MTSAPVSVESLQRTPSAFQTVAGAAISSMHMFFTRRPMRLNSSSEGESRKD
jgi:hypothetical protein